MSDKNHDVKLKLSLLRDNQLAPEDHPKLLEQLVHDQALRNTWARYNMIGDVIRTPKSNLVGPAFAQRVSRAIAQETAPLTVLSEKRSQRLPKQRFVSAKVAWALAASLAGFALVMEHPKTKPDLDQMDLVAEQAPPLGNDQYEKAAEARYNDYLMTHNEVSYLTGSASMLPHARLVSSTGR